MSSERYCYHCGKLIFGKGFKFNGLTLAKINYCFHCGARQGNRGTKLRGDMDNTTSGYIEIIFNDHKKKTKKPNVKNTGQFRIYADNDMEWMFPVEDAISPAHVLFLGLGQFLKATERRSDITLYCSDLDGVYYLLEKREPPHPDEKVICQVVRNKLKERPFVVLQYLEKDFVETKIKFLKSRFMKGQKGKGVPVKPEA